jgi:hypothetical protein
MQRREDQRFCSEFCRYAQKAEDHRAARALWREVGRPKLADRPVRREPQQQAVDRRF